MDTLKNDSFNFKLIIRESIRFFYEKFIKPKTLNEDDKRREFILNIFLLCSIIFFGISLIIILYQFITMPNFKGISPIIIFICLSFFLSLYILSRLNHSIISSYIFISLFFFITTFAIYKWGIELPPALLFYTLTIIMSGILINTRIAFIVTSIICLTVASIGYMQINGIIDIEMSWKKEMFGVGELTLYIIIYTIIATISWLSNRELEKSLKRARDSENELKKEKELLEIRVEERTRELQKVQLEKMTEMSRLAELGRLSSGLFHDLINPLTALSFNIEKIKRIQNQNHQFKEMEEDLNKAFKVTQRMREFISSIKKQINNEQNVKLFSLNQEINEAIQVLAYRTRKSNISIQQNLGEAIEVVGDPIKFNQVVLNLVSNAIDAYSSDNTKRNIDIDLLKNKDCITLYVKDHGKGIPKEAQDKIFKAFFTTKKDGTGLGLSLVKSIIEKDFNGTINFETNENKGTTFIIKFNQNINYD